jgi:hypothetical protein
VLGDIDDDDDGGDDGDEGPSEELGVGKGIGQTMRAQRAFVVAGVADERLARPPRRPDVARTPGKARTTVGGRAAARRPVSSGAVAATSSRRTARLPRPIRAGVADAKTQADHRWSRSSRTWHLGGSSTRARLSPARPSTRR